MKRRTFLKTLAGAAAGLQAPARFPTEKFKRFGALDSGHFEVVRVSESVFAVRGRENTGIPTNTAIVVGERGVAVVDTHLRPSLDREVIEIVGKITEQPIRYLINTHWHQDHTLGNLAYERTARIVAHASARKDMVERVVPNLQLQRELLPRQLSQAKEALEARTAARDVPEDELKRLALEIQLEEGYLAELEEIRIVLPREVFSESYVLDISNQTVELRHMGPAHTPGDIVIYLPDEKTIILGDLMTAGQPFMRPRDAVPSGWGPALERIKALDWDHAVTGHGRVDNPRGRLSMLIAYFRDLIDRTRQAIEANVAPEEIVRAVKLDEYAPYFPYFSLSVIPNIQRTYEELIRKRG